MSYTISKDFTFSASHVLEGLPEEHPCSRLHGHNYVARVTITSITLDPVGFVVDYRRLDPFKRWLDDNLDHRHLNGIVPFNPTAEHLAHYLADQVHNLLDLPGWITVAVSETPKTWASWTG